MVEPTPFKIVPPDDTPEFMYPAYFGCLRWAVGFDPVLKLFTADTGINLPKDRTPIEAAVDRACGFNPNEEFMRAFVPWFNEQVWGGMDGEEPDE